MLCNNFNHWNLRHINPCTFPQTCIGDPTEHVRVCTKLNRYSSSIFCCVTKHKTFVHFWMKPVMGTCSITLHICRFSYCIYITIIIFIVLRMKQKLSTFSYVAITLKNLQLEYFSPNRYEFENDINYCLNNESHDSGNKVRERMSMKYIPRVPWLKIFTPAGLCAT